MKYNDKLVKNLILGLSTSTEHCPHEFNLKDDDDICNDGLSSEICEKCWNNSLKEDDNNELHNT